MITEEQLKKLVAYIEKNYDAKDGARSSLDSEAILAMCFQME